MVEGAPLLREYTRNGIVGSNPIFSAILKSLADSDGISAGDTCRVRFTSLMASLMACTAATQLLRIRSDVRDIAARVVGSMGFFRIDGANHLGTCIDLRQPAARIIRRSCRVARCEMPKITRKPS